MTKDYVQMIGRMAYVWGYPMVNAHNRRVAFSEAPEPDAAGRHPAVCTGGPQRDADRLHRPGQNVSLSVPIRTSFTGGDSLRSTRSQW